MLIRPEAHDGEKEIPVRTMKTGLVSILAMGLLAGSPAGVAAQEGADAGEAPTEFIASAVDERDDSAVARGPADRHGVDAATDHLGR